VTIEVLLKFYVTAYTWTVAGRVGQTYKHLLFHTLKAATCPCEQTLQMLVGI